MKRKDKFGLHQILALIKGGFNPSKISKDYDISKQNIDYYIGKLKTLGCVEKKGYGTWAYIKEVPIVPKGSSEPQSSDLKKKQIRGHAFIWKIEFINKFDWNNMIPKYRKKKLTFQKICNKRVYRTIFNSRKIWLTKNGMIIYEPLDYLGPSSFKVKGTAVFELDKLIKALLKELGQKFRGYLLTTSREHYAIIKNELARQYNDKGEKLFIRNVEGTVWMWIDHSHGEHELENNEVMTNRQVQNFWNNHKKHNFKIDADFTLKNFDKAAKQIKKNAEHLEFHAENMRSHVKVVQELGTGVNKFNENIESLMEFLKENKK